MYRNEKTGRGCKVKTKQVSKGLSATSSTSQQHGESYDQCSSSGIHYVLNAAELAKSLTTSHPSSRVAIRWRGTTYKQCVIDVTTSNLAEKHTIESNNCPDLTKGGRS